MDIKKFAAAVETVDRSADAIFRRILRVRGLLSKAQDQFRLRDDAKRAMGGLRQFRLTPDNEIPREDIWSFVTRYEADGHRLVRCDRVYVPQILTNAAEVRPWIAERGNDRPNMPLRMGTFDDVMRQDCRNCGKQGLVTNCLTNFRPWPGRLNVTASMGLLCLDCLSHYAIEHFMLSI